MIAIVNYFLILIFHFFFITVDLHDFVVRWFSRSAVLFCVTPRRKVSFEICAKM